MKCLFRAFLRSMITLNGNHLCRLTRNAFLVLCLKIKIMLDLRGLGAFRAKATWQVMNEHLILVRQY
jgi:hypothetical protein